MRFKSVIAAATMLFAGLFAGAEAAPVTYTLTGFASGSVGATNFTNEAFTWTLSGDSATAIPTGGGGFALPFTSDVLNIAGIGMVTPTDQLFGAAQFFGPGTVGIVNEAIDGGILFGASALNGYNGLTSIGPLFVLYLDGALLASDQGDLSFSTLEMTFQVSGVPEPITIALFGAGLAGIGFVRRRKA
jgi:hypothetical protein